MGDTNVTRAVKEQGKPMRTGTRKQKVLVRIGIAMGQILLWVMAVILIAAIMVASQQGRPLGDVLALVLPNAGLIAGGITRILLETAFQCLLIMALEVIVHEGGHLLGGKLVGFRFVMVVLGPLKIVSRRNGIKVMRSNRQDPGWGAALSVPTTPNNLRWRMAVMAAAGPLATLALWLVCWWLSGVTQGATSNFFGLASLFSLVLGVANLLPRKIGGVLLDGALLKQLLMGGPQAERSCYLSLISGASRTGKRPREWDAEWIRRIIATPGDGTLGDAVAYHTAVYWALDMGNVDEAEHYLRRLIAVAEVLPATVPVRPLFFVDAAFFYAYYRHDPATARRFLDETDQLQDKPRGEHRHYWLRAEAATLAVEGDPDATRRVAQEGLEDITRNPPSGPGWELDKEWMEALAAV